MKHWIKSRTSARDEEGKRQPPDRYSDFGGAALTATVFIPGFVDEYRIPGVSRTGVANRLASQNAFRLLGRTADQSAARYDKRSKGAGLRDPVLRIKQRQCNRRRRKQRIAEHFMEKADRAFGIVGTCILPRNGWFVAAPGLSVGTRDRGGRMYEDVVENRSGEGADQNDEAEHRAQTNSRTYG